ncbi:hypothetical protein ANCCAN_09151 [Ancylostoma caninum]|uniref:Leucine Rich repeat-containing domain protein n=1 Tax=Ancylostoma caninum TaxID=29170 RepID=A0A368GMK4_ANCCA|nr:hypothetical protein ANCCAN_09151 [Ancylostoma caninum]
MTSFQYVDFSGNELSAETAEIIIKRWKETSSSRGRDVCCADIVEQLLRIEISRHQKDGILLSCRSRLQRVRTCLILLHLLLSDWVLQNLLSFSDDEGTMSDYSDSMYAEPEEAESGPSSDDEAYEMTALSFPEEDEDAHGNDKDVAELLKGVGCMKFASKDKVTAEDVVSFLDRQLKLNTAEDAEPVAQRIQQQKSMRVLELRGNTLGIESGKRIALAIQEHPELERCLWSDMFTGRLKDEIPPILKSLCNAMRAANCHITELDLSDNAFGPIGAEGIQDFLVSPSAFSLEVLKLNNNGLGAGGKVIAQCLSQCHTKSVAAGRPLKLKTFIAGRNRLEVPGASALATAFAKIGTLEEIALPQNGITAMGIGALASCFRSNPNLRVINLNDNTATQLGSEAIAKALSSLPNLEVLNLGDCLCRDQGCHAIVDALSPSVHKNLKELDLSGAELSGAAAKQIVEKWRKFPSKTKLILSSNNFGDMFEEVKRMGGKNVVVGDSDDDQGSLSSDDDERMSAADSSDDENEVQILNDKKEVPAVSSEEDDDPSELLKSCRDEVQTSRARFETATQEESARLILRLAAIVAKTFEKPEITDEVFDQVVGVAEDVLVRVKSIHRRPNSTTTQLVNNLIAQAGFVKCEEKWGIPVNREALGLLLHTLVSRTILADQQDVLVRVKSIHRRPNSTTTQLVNNLIAQAGFVKCEEKWGIPVNREALGLLLHTLVSRTILADQRELIRTYFGQP